MKKVDNCIGCRDNFYNGNNTYGISECWYLKTAKLAERKEVHIDQRPPWKQKPMKVLSCYKRPQYVYVNPETEH